MRKSRFSEEKIIAVLTEQERGAGTAEVRQAVVDQEPCAFIREIVRRLNDENLKHHHWIEWRPPDVRARISHHPADLAALLPCTWKTSREIMLSTSVAA